MQETILQRQREVENERKRLQLLEERRQGDKKHVENVQLAYVESNGVI